MPAASDQYSLLLKGNSMMSAVGEYALSVIVTVLVCAIVSDLVQDPGLNRILKMISGLVLTMTLVNPVFHLDFSYLSDWDLPVMESASAAAEDGVTISRESLCACIKQNTEAYIQEKADMMHSDVTVEVSLSADEIPVPVAAEISGSVSPSIKHQLELIIESQLGITKENIVWTG